MASKRQTTMAKLAREQAVRDRRNRKQEKREKKRAAALAKANPGAAEPAVDVSAADAEPAVDAPAAADAAVEATP